MNSQHSELELLQAIYSNRPDDPNNAKTLSQRDLAKRSGLSLGMTNALLRRFMERGWVKLLNASGRTLGYVLTPEGAEEIVLRSLRYFARAARSASLYRDKIEVFVLKAALDGFTTLVLDGPAELDFLFDYTCERHDMVFVKNPKGERRERLVSDSRSIFVMADFTLEHDAVGSVMAVPAAASASGATSSGAGASGAGASGAGAGAPAASNRGGGGFGRPDGSGGSGGSGGADHGASTVRLSTILLRDSPA
jgi:DNA-binding MarR family transcriptional regulator